MSVHRGIALKKSFFTDQRNFLGPLMRHARGDVRDHIVSSKKPQTFVLALKSFATAETSKNRLSRVFSASFDFRLLQQYPDLAVARADFRK